MITQEHMNLNQYFITALKVAQPFVFEQLL